MEEDISNISSFLYCTVILIFLHVKNALLCLLIFCSLAFSICYRGSRDWLDAEITGHSGVVLLPVGTEEVCCNTPCLHRHRLLPYPGWMIYSINKNNIVLELSYYD